MNIYLGIIFVLIIILTIISARFYLIKKSIKEIEVSTRDILKSDTNSLITISTDNKEVKALAKELNIELKNLREQRLQYEQI